ncbi:hypothetical protein GH714_027978 [Hevea brasiliensis]|uniref:Uncharacterized protein n=1 Tax=Hevea brasiliensis TaxID=3981 RepID=A0A6A6LBH7_HEVBR|nr:hypothetical protein GH714_027978 [Hevea brasiliensis]
MVHSNPSNDTVHGPVMVVNDLHFAGSAAPSGPVYAMDTRTGNFLWSYNSDATVYGGVSSSYGCIYFGNGYSVGLAARFHPTLASGTSLVKIIDMIKPLRAFELAFLHLFTVPLSIKD